MKKAFTLIELLIVIVIVGILSVLLFRTLGDMMKANARVQQEKILAQELISIQTSLNNISEQYPYLDQSWYTTMDKNSQWFVSTLYLKNGSGDKINISGTGDCSEECYMVANFTDKESLPLSNKNFSKASNIVFKILPIQYFTKDQYENTFERENISQPGFWIFGKITNNLKNWTISKVSYNLQHFINLQLESSSDNTTASINETINNSAIID